MHLPFSTLQLWNISAPAAAFLSTCVASEVSEGALLTGVAAAAAYQNEEVVSPIETARKRMIIVAAAAGTLLALLLFWPVSFPERFFFAN